MSAHVTHYSTACQQWTFQTLVHQALSDVYINGGENIVENKVFRPAVYRSRQTGGISDRV
jgi:hypothetical protein